jgi:hypothetical protein
MLMLRRFLAWGGALEGGPRVKTDQATIAASATIERATTADFFHQLLG